MPSNRLPLHFLLILSSVACSLAFAAGPVTERQYLSGTDKDHTVQWDFSCDHGQNSGKQATIAVPSNWELQGFGTYTYGTEVARTLRLATRAASRPGAAAIPRPDVTGTYRHAFRVPQDWSGKRVRLVFDGSMTDTHATVNGKEAGPIHRGGYYRFSYDVTDLLNWNGADNQLEVVVNDFSSNPNVNGAERSGDYWNYGGIFRPVYLEAAPAGAIERLAADAKADGSLAVDVYLLPGAAAGDRVEARLVQFDGTPVGAVVSAAVQGNASAGTEGETPAATVKAKFDGLKLWTAETPNLYRVEVCLLRGDAVVHSASTRVGFRTMEVRPGDGLYVNGKRVLLKGCCRHSFWPESGRCTSPDVSTLDVETIQGMNMNAVRTSHYPPDESFLDLCDERGLYVLDEIGGWHHHYDTALGHTLVHAMVARDVNHPSILFWDNGNEGGFNLDLDRDYPHWDPQGRTVLHPWTLFGNVNTKHYPDLPTVKKLCDGPDVYMPTECLHAMDDGGGGAQLAAYWDVMKHSKFSGGAFIWAYLDESVKRTDLDGKLDAHGNDAPDGLVGPHREKEGSYFTVRQVWSPLQIATPDLSDAAKFDGTLTVENGYDFTDVKDCKLTWELRRFSAPRDPKGGHAVVASGVVTTPSIAPATTGQAKLDLPSNWKSSDALAVVAADPTGRVISEWVWPTRADVGRTPPPVASGAAPAVSSDATAFTLTGGPVTAHVDRSSGTLIDVAVSGKPVSLKNGPRLAAATGDAPAASAEPFHGENSAGVEVRRPAGLKQVRWTIHPDGRLQLDYRYDVPLQNGNPAATPFTGITFDYPATLTSKRWLGNGPFRVYQNRLEGGTLGVWETPYNDTATGFTYTYPEFKGYFSNVRWMTLNSPEGDLTVSPQSNDVFVRVQTPALAPVPMGTAVAYPPGDLSILNTIPPVGAKQRVAPPVAPTEKEFSGSVTFQFATP